MKNLNLSLYLVTDRVVSNRRPIEIIVKEAVEGGVTMIQLREKDLDTLNFYNLAVKLKRLLEPYDVPLIINDRVDIALAMDADGVHIGQKDLPYAVVRQLLGHDKIIGLSVENFGQALAANDLDVDYVALSPIFEREAKSHNTTPFGTEGIRNIMGLSTKPLVACGGINATNAKSVIDSGASGVAVVSALCSAPDVKAAARELRTEIDNAIAAKA